MSRICLDTSAYSHLQRGNPMAARVVDGAEWVGMPAITLGELRAGFLIGGRPEQNDTCLQDFLANAVVEVLGVDDEVSRHYADIVHDLRRSGTPIPTNDIWIAASAARAGAAILTTDAHFTAIARVGSIMLE